MKRTRFFPSAIALVLTVVMVALLVTPAYAAIDNNAYTFYASSIQSEWKASTEMVDWSSDRWTAQWVEWLCKTGYSNPTFAQKVEATYDAVVNSMRYNQAKLDEYIWYKGAWTRIGDVDNDDLGDYIEQFTFSEILAQVAKYSAGNGSRPLGLCGDISRFMVGLLRAQGIPAYIERGRVWMDGRYRYHDRVVVIDEKTYTGYYSDPTFGLTSGDVAKWRWLIKSEYDTSSYGQSHIASEKLPNKKPTWDSNGPPPAENPVPQPPIIRPDYPDAYKITVLQENRWGDRDIVVPIRKNGTLIGNIPMRVLYYDGSYWFTVRDACAVLANTTRAVNVSWSAYRNTVVFERGEYKWDGSEVNWGYGRNSYGSVIWTGVYQGISIDKTSQAYMMPNAWFGSQQTNIRVINIGGTNYVRPIDVAKMMNFDGSVSYETELGGTFKFR